MGEGGGNTLGWSVALGVVGDASIELGDVARAREAGITCCLIKPFTPDELLECVHEALAKSQTRRAIPKS